MDSQWITNLDLTKTFLSDVISQPPVNVPTIFLDSVKSPDVCKTCSGNYPYVDIPCRSLLPFIKKLHLTWNVEPTSGALVNHHNFSLSQVQCPATIFVPHASEQTSGAHVNHHSFGLSPAQCEPNFMPHMPSEARVHDTYVINILPRSIPPKPSLPPTHGTSIDHHARSCDSWGNTDRCGCVANEDSFDINNSDSPLENMEDLAINHLEDEHDSHDDEQDQEDEHDSHDDEQDQEDEHDSHDDAQDQEDVHESHHDGHDQEPTDDGQNQQEPTDYGQDQQEPTDDSQNQQEPADYDYQEDYNDNNDQNDYQEDYNDNNDQNDYQEDYDDNYSYDQYDQDDY